MSHIIVEILSFNKIYSRPWPFVVTYMCKNRRPYNLYCVGAHVKPCSINRVIS